MHIVSLFTLLALFWLVNSGHYTPLILSLGAISILLVVWIAQRMNVVDHESQPLHLTRRVPGYWLWLLKQIARANVDVVRRIWRGRSSIAPQRVILRAGQQTDMGRVIYANSITLTPATVAMDLDEQEVVVHALTPEAAAELEAGEMNSRVCELEP